MEEVTFLFDSHLTTAVEDLIKNSKQKLLLVSPFIDLDTRIVDALKEKITARKFELLILFGKNENNYLKSIKKESLDFLKQFPNIEIRYNERLHAKFYQNDFEYIMTSLNLYKYSMEKNIEVGIKRKFASKGIVGKAIGDGSIIETLIKKSVYKVKQNVLGMKNPSENPIKKFEQIFFNSEIMYKTEPTVVNKSGLQGLVGIKKLDGFNVLVDKFKSNNINDISEKQMGYCIKTKERIPFNINRPFLYKVWKELNKDENVLGTYCHYSGELSFGKNSKKYPVLTKNWKEAKEKFNLDNFGSFITNKQDK